MLGQNRREPFSMPQLWSAAVLSSLLALSLQTAVALPAPGTYEKLKREAEEVLKIRVIAVERKNTPSTEYQFCTITAKVISVTRSQSGLRRAETIRFTSFICPRERLVQGPAQPPLIKPNWKGHIYLNTPVDSEDNPISAGDEALLELAADGRSFEPSPLSRKRHSIYIPTMAQIKSVLD